MQADRIKNLFSVIARHYDFLNSLLSLTRDKTWRQETVKASDVEPASKVLDVCTGTGELALAYSDKITAEGFVIASDFCFEMLVIGDQKVERNSSRHAPSCRNTSFLAADTLTLPFLDNTFDVVSVGFGIRNVSDLEMGIREMTRVAAPGRQGRYLRVYATCESAVSEPLLFLFYEDLAFCRELNLPQQRRRVRVSSPFCYEISELRCLERGDGTVWTYRCAVSSENIRYRCDPCREETE